MENLGMNNSPAILITGNQGYVGSVLVRHLRHTYPKALLLGFDAGFFGHALTGSQSLPEACLTRQIYGDVRHIPDEIFEGIDAVVQLAAISNDPMGSKFEKVTYEINQQASVDIATKAAKYNVRNFVLASSCSVYGFAPGAPRTEGDKLNPQTAYAKSKVGTEQVLAQADLGDMVVTSLRFATACGMSDRLRLDLVLNDFVACALASRKITVLSDGTPWRPLIDVRDMARAIDWACLRTPDNGGKFLAVNVGSNDWNYQVKDLAAAVANLIPGTGVSINQRAQADTRSYQVNFSLFSSLAPRHQPGVSLHQSIEGLRDGLTRMGFADPDFRNSRLIRLRVLEDHISAGRLSNTLHWQPQPEGMALNEIHP
jgi:nucleoside-diphosphate-sugar epimerase